MHNVTAFLVLALVDDDDDDDNVIVVVVVIFPVVVVHPPVESTEERNVPEERQDHDLVDLRCAGTALGASAVIESHCRTRTGRPLPTCSVRAAHATHCCCTTAVAQVVIWLIASLICGFDFHKCK